MSVQPSALTGENGVLRPGEFQEPPDQLGHNVMVHGYEVRYGFVDSDDGCKMLLCVCRRDGSATTFYAPVRAFMLGLLDHPSVEEVSPSDLRLPYSNEEHVSWLEKLRGEPAIALPLDPVERNLPGRCTHLEHPVRFGFVEKGGTHIFVAALKYFGRYIPAPQDIHMSLWADHKVHEVMPRGARLSLDEGEHLVLIAPMFRQGTRN